MGWSSGTDIYLVVEDAFNDIIQEAYDGGGIYSELINKAFQRVAEALQDKDWDCEDEALSRLDDHTWAYAGLLQAMGRDPNCPGLCIDVHEASDYDSCGCVCHAET